MNTMKSLPVRDTAAADPVIGSRLRLARMERHLTVEELAEATGQSKAFISRVERDLKLPSIPALLSLCRALRIEVGEVFRTALVEFVPLAEAPHVDLGGTGISEQLVTPVHQRKLQMVRSVIEPGGRSEDEAYMIECELESAHLISGTFVMTVDGQEHTMTPGDTLSLPGNAAHTWHNPGPEPVVILWAMAG